MFSCSVLDNILPSTSHENNTRTFHVSGFWFRTLTVFQLGVVVVGWWWWWWLGGGVVFCHSGRIKKEWAAKEGVTISSQEKKEKKILRSTTKNRRRNTHCHHEAIIVTYSWLSAFSFPKEHPGGLFYFGFFVHFPVEQSCETPFLVRLAGLRDYSCMEIALPAQILVRETLADWATSSSSSITIV